jgi:hypothetical protein
MFWQEQFWRFCQISGQLAESAIGG